MFVNRTPYSTTAPGSPAQSVTSRPAVAIVSMPWAMTFGQADGRRDALVPVDDVEVAAGAGVPDEVDALQREGPLGDGVADGDGVEGGPAHAHSPPRTTIVDVTVVTGSPACVAISDRVATMEWPPADRTRVDVRGRHEDVPDGDRAAVDEASPRRARPASSRCPASGSRMTRASLRWAMTTANVGGAMTSGCPRARAASVSKCAGSVLPMAVANSRDLLPAHLVHGLGRVLPPHDVRVHSHPGLLVELVAGRASALSGRGQPTDPAGKARRPPRGAAVRRGCGCRSVSGSRGAPCACVQRGQNFASSIRSGSLRRFFLVM